MSLIRFLLIKTPSLPNLCTHISQYIFFSILSVVIFFTPSLEELKIDPEFYILAACVPLPKIYLPLILKVKHMCVYVYACGVIVEMKLLGEK